MKGERSITGKPFRYAGIMHDYDKTSDDWAEYMPEYMSKCYICGGKMGNIVVNGTLKPLTDYDLAVQWAVGRIGEKKGYPCYVTAEEIWQELPEQFREEE